MDHQPMTISFGKKIESADYEVRRQEQEAGGRTTT